MRVINNCWYASKLVINLHGYGRRCAKRFDRLIANRAISRCKSQGDANCTDYPENGVCIKQQRTPNRNFVVGFEIVCIRGLSKIIEIKSPLILTILEKND